MKKLLLIPFILLCHNLLAQTPVPMSTQTGLTYTENFADIANWTNNFAAGTGAAAFKGIVGATATGIPNATQITTSTTAFVTTTTGGVQRGTGNIVLLSTGATDKSSSAAIDFYANFSGVDAGKISFDWATVFNSTGNRAGSLLVYTSTNGTTFTELTSASTLNFINNVTSSGSITNISLPTSFNNVSSCIIRFYYYNGTGGSTGSRPKVSIDNLKITATALGADITPPTVTTFAPANGATSANLTFVPKLTFSENIQKGTGNITIKNLTDATQVVVDVTSSDVVIADQVLSINNLASFVNGKSYAIQLAAGAIKDVAATPNDFAGITDNTTWAFSFNANPKAIDDAFSVYKNELYNGNVATNDSDPNASALVYSKLTDPTIGSLTFNTDGTFSYTPQAAYVGVQTFTYRVTNNESYFTDATVTLNIAERTNVIISQYYEGTGTNKWIELTNVSSAAINTASPQLQLALYNISGDANNITYTNATVPTQKMNLTVTIPAKGSVIIGNSSNGAEVSYISTASANQLNSDVINFNGNDGIALLDANNQIVDAFGQGINAKDVSYERNQNITTTSSSFIIGDWTLIPITDVQEADDKNNPIRLGIHIPVIYYPCVAPSAAATQLAFSNVGFTSMDAAFTASAATDEYLVVRSLQATLGAGPIDGTTYNEGDAIGNGAVITRTANTNFSSLGLSYGTTYYYFIYSLNNGTCTGGPLYQTTSLSGSQQTNTPPVCAAPLSQATNFSIGLYNYNFIQGNFDTTTADEYLVVMSTNPSLGATPVDGTVYTVNQTFGNGIVVKRGQGGTFTKTGLTPSTNYYFTIFALNSTCTGGPVYQTNNPLLGNQTTMSQNSGALNFYFGNLHAHTSSSDGNKEDLSKGPVDDYAFAKTADHMDFLGISEHNHTGAGMSLSKWKPGLAAAKAATTPTFTAIYGMEWGTISAGGHAVIYGIDSLIGWEPSQYDIYVAKGVYRGTNGLFNIINRHGLNAFAYLAHPNTTDYNDLVSTYDAAADQAVIGAAVESGPAFSTNITYTNPASSMSYLSYFQSMLARGYHIGPAMDHDNHYLTFGKTSKSRLAILAPANTENDLLNAMKARNFYATEDYAAKVGFSINSKPMGSILTARNAPELTVNIADATTAVSTIKIMYGTPGSGALPVQLTSATSSNTLSYTDNGLLNLATGYYYADILESDGTRTISSPIWYSRDDNAVLPITLSDFNVKASGHTVNINWTTSAELNNNYFTLERSDDGKNFAKIGEVKGAGTSQQNHDYQFTDLQPYTGVNYYRIRQTDFDGKYTNSEVKAVKILGGADKGFNIYPNPAQQQVTLALNSAANDLELQVLSLDGKILLKGKGNVSSLNESLNQKLGTLQTGVYIIKISNRTEAYQAKLIKQ